MAAALERYQKLGLRESLSRIYDYPSACNELSFILRGAYSKVHKNLQAIMFQDTLAAFRLLPGVQIRSAISAANLLLQSAEVALPKQKRVLAVTEFKHAVVAHKRRCKARQEEEGSAQLPEDVLVHLFSFLDMRSLVSVGLVCWSWNLAASDNNLWKLQYAILFGNSDNCSEIKEQLGGLAQEKGNTILYHKKDGIDAMTSLGWREAFKKTYIGIEVVEYLLEDSLSTISYLDSDSDTDSDSEGGSISKLWAYPRHISSSRRRPFV
ncbi:hypothetical protein HHK36_000136 [Tetracentron sinense]|uniref:F-box domain-containing protein n=1 Tax=Tetracentron sinense TaxID=13715 RepID=A0A835A129_TETSI|nr:hypothetical protein HHK36_000136 [Tetracentron sinense]